jgi:hypothetical protein
VNERYFKGREQKQEETVYLVPYPGVVLLRRLVRSKWEVFWMTPA